MATATDHTPSVAIILVNWNGHLDTVRCIESLQKITYPSFRIIVVDNGSSPESVEYLQQHTRGIEFIHLEQNTGFTGGNNTGIAKAIEMACEVIVLLNNDTTVEGDFLEPLVSDLQDKQIGAVQPKICYMADVKRIWNAGGDYQRIFGRSVTRGKDRADEGSFDKEGPTDWITGCCLAARKEIFESVGLLDDRFFAYFEDVDLSMRIRSAGYTLRYQPKSKIYHAVSMSSRNKSDGEGTISPRVIYYNVRNHLLIARRYATGLTVVSTGLFQIGKVLVYSLYFLLRGRRRKLAAVLQGAKDGLRD